MKPVAAIITVGCRLNHADSGLIHARLAAAGYTVAEYAETSVPPSLVIINGCAVTANASATTRSAIRRVRREYPDCEIVVTGCDAAKTAADTAEAVVRVAPDKRFAIPGLTIPADRNDSDDFPLFYEGISGDPHFRSRAFIKVQEGCNNFCAYCIVPFTRGRERSRDWEETLADCRNAVAAGFAELVLTGVNICSYRCEKRDLADLLLAISDIRGDFRIRLSSTEPHPEDKRFIKIFAELARAGKVCRFLHLPLQHGCDSVLDRMRRRYKTAGYRDFVGNIRAEVADIHIGTDLIAGLPGETEEEFAAGLEFVREMDFANAHVFTYSKREGTVAASMPDMVPQYIARQREKRIREVTDCSAARFLASQRGKVLPVLFERLDKDGFAEGWSDNYICVKKRDVQPGRIIPCVFG